MRRISWLVVVAFMTTGVAGEEPNPEDCERYAPLVRAEAIAGRALLSQIIASLPDDLEKRALDGDVSVSETVPAPSGSIGRAIGDYMTANLRLIVPLTQYTERAEIAASVLEACAKP
jgi:hypothetical protein